MATTPSPAPTYTYNDDIDGLQRRINRFLVELANAASASVSLTSAFDQTRLSSYLNAVTTYQDWIVSQPLLDFVETDDQQITLEPNPTIPEVENEDLNDIISLFERARDELVSSQSARMSSGLIAFDSARLTATITKANNFLTAYIQKTTPLDLPQSSPDATVANTGAHGV